MEDQRGKVLVIGAGIGGIRASLDLAELGFKVYLVDHNPNIGGTLMQLDKWFPDNHCGMCKMLPVFARDEPSQFCLRQGLLHPNIELNPLTQVEKVEGEAGDFVVTLRSEPSGVNTDLCLGCGLCAQACPVEVPSEFNQGLAKRKAIYPSQPWTPSNSYVIDWNACTRCGTCVENCPANAIDLSEQAKDIELKVGAIVLSTGFEGFNPRSATQYGYQRYPNVITSIELERILSPTGPSEGNLVRPSDGEAPESIAFLQCVGSRDTQRDYCSSACCMYAIKEATLIKEAHPETDVHIFFMDMRTFGKGYYRYYEQAKGGGINFTRCRVPVVKQEPKTKDLLITAPIEDGSLVKHRFELIVLSIGQSPASKFQELSQVLEVELNRWGFCQTQEFSPMKTTREGIYVCGSASGPKDIADTSIEAGAAACQASISLSPRLGQPPSLEPFERQDSDEEEPRIAIFLCQCGEEIASKVDLRGIAQSSQRLSSVVGVEEVPYLCQKDFLGKVKEKVKGYKANRVVLGACTPFFHRKPLYEVAKEIGVNPSFLHLLSLREEVAWSHRDEPEAATEKGKRLLAMGVERVRLQHPSTPSNISTNQAALVIGGGLAGLTSALAIAEQGFEVYLIEREPELGGNLKDIYFTLEDNDPQALLKEIVQKAEDNPSLHIYKATEISCVTGYVGNFNVSFTAKDKALPSVKVGAIIIAAGGEEYQPTEYLYGQSEGVVTQKELEKRLAKGELKGVESVVMIQCVGSRDKDRPYCSRVCCSQALKNALHLKEQNPQAEILILYRDMMSYGFREGYYTKAREKGILFIRYDMEDKPEVRLEEGKLKVEVTELALKGKLRIEPDLVVLSPAIIPRGHQKLAKMLDLELTEDGFFKEAESKFRPVDFVKEGIFVCGLAHSPRSIGESIAQAQAAAQRAVSILARERLQSGRVVSEVNERWCTGCGICVEACPYGARVKDEERGVVIVREALCQGCGACAVACPSGAAKLRGFTEKQAFAMVDAAI